MMKAAARAIFVQANTEESPGMTHPGLTTQAGEKVHLHSRRDTMKAQSGFTLVEVMVVVGIIGIILTLVTLNFKQMNDKYTVESYTKEIHSILMRARNDAANTNTPVSVTLAAHLVTTTTTNPYPHFTIQFATSPIVFDRRGMTNDHDIQTIRITGYSNTSPGVDCIVVAVTRINMGRWDGGNCVQQ